MEYIMPTIRKTKPLNVFQLISLVGFKSQDELKTSLDEFVKDNGLEANFNLPKISGLENNSYIPNTKEFFALRDYFKNSLGDGVCLDIIAVRREDDNILLDPEDGTILERGQGEIDKRLIMEQWDEDRY